MSDAKAEAAAPKSKKNVLLYIVIGVLVLVIVVGGALAAWLVMSASSHSPDAQATEEDGHGADAEKKKKKEKKKKGEETAPVFEKLDTFTVNLAGDGNVMLQTEIFVELYDEHSKESLKSFVPKIRNEVIMLLTSKQPAQVVTAEGKNKLREELKVQINKAIGASGEDEGIKDVAFSSFIVQ